MSVDIKDYRRHLRDTDKSVETPAEPVEQVSVEDSRLTGHDQFDKLIRALQHDIDAAEVACTGLAQKGMGAVQDEMLRLVQFEYMYTKGKIDAWKAASLLPKKILDESKFSA